MRRAHLYMDTLTNESGLSNQESLALLTESTVFGMVGKRRDPRLNAGSSLGMARDPIDPSLNGYGASQRYMLTMTTRHLAYQFGRALGEQSQVPLHKRPILRPSAAP